MAKRQGLFLEITKMYSNSSYYSIVQGISRLSIAIHIFSGLFWVLKHPEIIFVFSQYHRLFWNTT